MRFAELVQHLLQVLWQRRFEIHRPAVGGVRECQPRGVEERPLQPEHGPQVLRHARRTPPYVASPTIGWPMALRWTRIWCVRPVAIATWHSVTPLQVLGARDSRHRRSRAPRARRHLLPVFGVAPDRQVDAAPGLHDAPDQRHVFLLDLAVRELPRQRLVRRVVLGDDHHA